MQRHLPLVRSLARRYAGRGEALEDIEQVGAIGLIKAIDRYELSREVALTTYATPNVVGEIKRHFRDKGWAIRVPRALQELNGKMAGDDRAADRAARAARRASPRSPRSSKTTPGAGARGDGGGLRLRARVAVGRARPARSELDPMETIGGEDEEFERSEDRAVARARARAAARRASARSCACASRTACTQTQIARADRHLADARVAPDPEVAVGDARRTAPGAREDDR